MSSEFPAHAVLWGWTGSLASGIEAVEAVTTDDRPRYRAAPEDIRHDNTRKAQHAVRALATYRQESSALSGDPFATVAADLIADLLLALDALGIDPEQVVQQAQEYFEDESGRP